jgi:hypothetical protein
MREGTNKLKYFKNLIHIFSLSPNFKANQLKRKDLWLRQPTTLNEWEYGGLNRTTKFVPLFYLSFVDNPIPNYWAKLS